MTGFKRQLLIFGAKVLVRVLLKRVSVDSLLAFIREAEQRESTNDGKREYVYNILKSHEIGRPEHILNLVLELGVYLYKLYTNKKAKG